jgi:hypothetical protein
MYKVITKEGFAFATCSSLNSAMAAAKAFDQFVTIRGPNGMEFVGRFGVDSVVDGKTPDGVAYTWNKASRIGKTRK